MRPTGLSWALSAAFVASTVSATYVDPNVLDACPGYKATDVISKGSSLTANLVLAGAPCNVFGNDTEKLKLEVTYETSKIRGINTALNLPNSSLDHRVTHPR